MSGTQDWVAARVVDLHIGNRGHKRGKTIDSKWEDKGVRGYQRTFMTTFEMMYEVVEPLSFVFGRDDIGDLESLQCKEFVMMYIPMINVTIFQEIVCSRLLLLP